MKGTLLVVAQRAAADEVAGLRSPCRRLAVPFRQVVLAEVVADRRQVVGRARHDRALGHAAVALARDAVVVGLGVLARVDEVRLLDAGEVAAVGEHRLEEEHRALLELAHAIALSSGFSRSTLTISRRPSMPTSDCLAVSTAATLL